MLVIEGIDGAGKTTQAQLVQEKLESRNLSVVRTKEPTAGLYGRKLRDSATDGRMSLQEEVDTFILDRREHVEYVIRPALSEGKIVIVDRYYFSTVAYQGALGLDPQDLLRRNESFAPEPDLLILLDLDPRQGLARIERRGDLPNHFERADTLIRAREIFLSITKPYLVVLNAELDPAQLQETIVGMLSGLIVERIAKSNADTKTKLNETLLIHGGKPIV